MYNNELKFHIVFLNDDQDDNYDENDDDKDFDEVILKVAFAKE